jgi:hypothetical protein
MDRSHHFLAPAAFPPRYSLYRRLRILKRRAECTGQEKNSNAAVGNRTPTVQSVYRYVTLLLKLTCKTSLRNPKMHNVNRTVVAVVKY